jgi:Uma2 family endonuclease
MDTAKKKKKKQQPKQTHPPQAVPFVVEVLSQHEDASTGVYQSTQHPLPV